MPDSNRQTGYTNTSMPGMNQILGNAAYVFNSGKAWRPDTTSHVTPFSTQTKNALSGLEGSARGATGTFGNSFANLSATLNDGGLNDMQDQQAGRLQQTAGGNGLNTMQQSGADWLQRIASGGDMQNNPYLEDTIKRGSQDIANADNLMASVNGRYGSGSHAGVLQKNIGDFAGGLRFNDYEGQLKRRDSAIRDYFGMGTTGHDQRTDAINSLYNIGSQQRENNIAAPGQLAAGYNASLTPWQTLGKVGEAYEQKNQQILDDKTRVFNETKQSMTDPINWLSNIAGAYKGGQQVTNERYNPLLNALGGAASGYDIFGGPIGGAVGGLAGLFS